VFKKLSIKDQAIKEAQSIQTDAVKEAPRLNNLDLLKEYIQPQSGAKP
jgi:hypothetical protein